MLSSVLENSIQQLLDSQMSDGSWKDCFDTGCMPDAQTAISLYLLDWKDWQWIEVLLTRIRKAQRLDGSWGVYPGDHGDLSTTVECYYALQIYNAWGESEDQKRLAQQFIQKRGGLRKCRNLTKIFLALGGEIPWSWLPSPRFYLPLFFKYSPIDIEDLVTFTRLHVPPMLILSSLQYVACPSGNFFLKELLTDRQKRTVLRTTMYHSVNWLKNAAFRRCVTWMDEEQEADGTLGGYHSSSFLWVFAKLALGYPRDHPEVERILSAIRQSLYQDIEDDFYHQQTCDAHIWNTALAMQALGSCGILTNSMPLRKAAQYLLAKQHRIPDRLMKNKGKQLGGWAFSSNNTCHPDVDDTVASLEALAPLADECAEAWWQGIDWLLSMQNRDGGWSAFEKDCNQFWLDWLPANDMKRAMIDPSTPDITGRVVEFLVNHKILSCWDARVRKAIYWLRNHQEADGSWFGRWGTTYIYGTWCAVKALVVVGIPSDDESLRKAKGWLLSIQMEDGSFGESCQSDLCGKYVELSFGLPTQTAWALDTLLYLYQLEVEPRIRQRLWLAAWRAARWLLKQGEKGRWHEEIPTGSGFPGALHIRYHIYPKVWPLIALNHFQKCFELVKRAPMKGGEQSVRPQTFEYVP